jgi:TonB-linked SusC/RagA family outer membrane protein
VVIGYGTQKKSDLTGSVSRANIEQLKQSPNVSFGQSLQGTVPGLNVGMVNRAGQDPAISIRGLTTISGNQNVLIVLDGIIYNGSLASINQNDIASIDVLKDASSTAIYGAQAANGVLLITTKKGTSDTPKISFSSQIASQTPANALTPMNREQFLKKNRDLYWDEAYLAPDYITPNPAFDMKDALYVAHWDGYDNGTDFNWWDAGTQTGYIIDNQLSISGRSANFNYLFSGGHTGQRGFIKNDDFTRKTLRINIESTIKPWLTLGIQSFGSFSDYSGETPDINELMRTTPLVPAYNADGSLNVFPNKTIDLNPFIGTLTDDLEKRNALFGNIYIDLKFPFLQGLSYRVNYGHNYRTTNQYNSNEYAFGEAGNAIKQDIFYYDYTLDNILTFNRSFADRHDLTVTLLYGVIERQNRSTTAEARDFSRLNLSYHSLQQGNFQFTRSAAWDEAVLYQMARVNYKYNGKYLFTGTLRNDGFSGFASNNKTALFPSVALGWILSEESFMDFGFINMLKLRASYGVNGNLTSRYSSLARVTPNISYVFGDGGSTEFGQQVATLPNDKLRWERTGGFNYGLDFSLFNYRLTGNIEYYHTTTNDLLFTVRIPTMTGFNAISSNVGEVANRGIEFALNPVLIEQKNFRWDVSLNFSRNINQINELVGLDADGDGKEDDLVASGLFIGQSINSIFDYQIEGIYQIGDDRPSGYPIGSYRLRDNDGDGNITPDDRVILGREEPAYRFSVFNTISYKNFTLRTLINSIQGGKDGYLGANIVPGDERTRENNMLYNAVEYDYWTPSNPDAMFKHTASQGAINPYIYRNRNFIRLQDISLTYNFNNNLLQRLQIDGLNIFISVKNLATWTKWIGWDPETGTGLAADFPVLRSYSFGFNLEF